MHNIMFWRVRAHLSCALFALSICTGAHAQASAGSTPPEGRVPAEFWDAVRHDDADRVQTLLLRGVDTDATHPEDGPAITVAARERAWKTLSLLAGITGTNVDAANRLGETALMLAALNAHLGSVRLLVARGAEVNRPGWTPLHYAATGGRAEIVSYLLDQNAYIDAQSPNRTTPLMMAARQNQPAVVRLLVEAGADPGARNEAGLDAADYLQRHGDAKLAAWLRERAADYARRYGTLERPRTLETIEEEKRRSEQSRRPRLPGMRD